jgi:hypothetical protein
MYRNIKQNRINMVISNGNTFPAQLKTINVNNTPNRISIPTPLFSGMIANIQSAKVGCGGCGKH